MANLLQQAGAMSEPTAYAPLHTNRIFTGLWTNRSLLRDAATSEYYERAGMGRQDSILDGRNSEISTRLTLRRRYGNSIWDANAFNTPHRFFSFNTFTLTTEVIHVLVDEPGAVYNAEQGGARTLVWTKAPGAGPTFFLAVGNTLYFTNGVENKQWNYGVGGVKNWGIPAPTVAPSVSFPAYQNYGQWIANTVFSRANIFARVLIVDPNGNVQNATTVGKTGAAPPAVWDTREFYATIDGGVTWQNWGTGQWAANASRSANDLLYRTASDGNTYFYQAQISGTTGGGEPIWLSGIDSVTVDNQVTWLNLGKVLHRTDIGDSINILGVDTILDTNGAVQVCRQAGKTGTTPPGFNSIRGAFTADPVGVLTGQVLWKCSGSIGPVQYGYAVMDSSNKDTSGMSPRSVVVSTNDGQSVYVQGPGADVAQGDTIIVYRTAHGGSTFLKAGTLPNPGAGITWTFGDQVLDADLDPTWQAQVGGEGTPLPAGASCLGYHLGRIFAAVGNVVYVSAGGDAIPAQASGNSGFPTTFTCQSKITRFWTCSLGMVVFTVRDAYIILGSATANDPLYMVVFIEQLPLLHYDAFTVNKTTPYLLLGNKMLVALDPGAGIIEVGYPIADRLRDEFDPKTAYVTFHSQSSEETALYVGNANGRWYRMNQNNAPESGMAWSTRAEVANMGALQSVEVDVGVWRLLWGAATGAQAIMQRDLTKFTDNGTPYPASAKMGSIVLALPGQLAELFFITLESVRVGTRAGLALLLGELSGEFETLKRTRQDPPNLPPSETIFSDRYHFEQNQRAAWCRHFQMEISWPAEDAANELLTFTIFGQSWQEMRQQ